MTKRKKVYYVKGETSGFIGCFGSLKRANSAALRAAIRGTKSEPFVMPKVVLQTCSSRAITGYNDYVTIDYLTVE